MSKVYELVTQKIIKKLEKGAVPWKKPFAERQAVNWLTQRPYRGINTLLLDGGEYATYKQIIEHGGQVKKGEKSHIVVFFKWIEIEQEKDGESEVKKIPLLRYYRVFEINTQCKGLESRRKDKIFDHNPIEKAERIVQGYSNAPKISHVSGRAYYSPLEDRVNVPNKRDFEKVEDYYSVLFHELIHSTGHKSRLNREGIVSLANNPFGSEEYSKEELIAEIGASMLCGVVGIEHATLDNTTAYIQGWLKALKNDKRLIILASQQAQKASDYILGEKGDLYD